MHIMDYLDIRFLFQFLYSPVNLSRRKVELLSHQVSRRQLTSVILHGVGVQSVWTPFNYNWHGAGWSQSQSVCFFY